MSSLFQLGSFKLASGRNATWKIECDALTDSDWECIAELIMNKFVYSEVYGVPTGGNKLASILSKRLIPYVKSTLIVDDVYTTGGSIRAMREKLMMRPDSAGRHYAGCVLFARQKIIPADSWVFPIFQFQW